MKNILTGKKAAILIADNFHVLEAFYPYFRLKEAGMKVFFVGDEAGKVYYDYNGEPLKCDLSIYEALKQQYDLVFCPGGFAPMKLRSDEKMLKFAIDHFQAGKLFAAICHAGSFLVSMDVLKGKKATSYFTLKDDLLNAGAEYIDDAPVLDGNLITARTPDDLPGLLESIILYLRFGPDQTKSNKQPGNLEKKNVGILIEPRYSLHQVWYPYLRMKAEGANVSIIGENSDTEYYSRISKFPINCNCSVQKASSGPLDILLIPGDWAADKMRTKELFLNLVKLNKKNNGLTVSIGEGHSVLISAKIITGKKIASLPEMKKELENCNAVVVDQPSFVDCNLITARDTEDLPELMKNILGNLN